MVKPAIPSVPRTVEDRREASSRQVPPEPPKIVLPALFVARWGVVRGYAAASICFGLWHVLPALSLNKVNPVATRLFGSGVGGVAVAVVFAVFSTALAGAWWCWIRHRSGSVLATMMAHVASNSVAYTIAWLVAR